MKEMLYDKGNCPYPGLAGTEFTGGRRCGDNGRIKQGRSLWQRGSWDMAALPCLNQKSKIKNQRSIILLPLLLLLTCCSTSEPASEGDLLNTAHLEHLYQEVSIGDTLMGVVWIYCEAPDYRLVGDEDEGFTCVDDLARALVFYCRQYRSSPSEAVLEKARRLAEFLLYMQADNGYFYNFLMPGNIINREHPNSRAVPNWWSWRAFWALSELNLLEAEGLAGLQGRSRRAMDALLPGIRQLCSGQEGMVEVEGVSIPQCLTQTGADQVGVLMAGLANYYQLRQEETVRETMLNLGNLLLAVQFGGPEAFPFGAFMSWKNTWHAWGNLQAYGLLHAGRVLEHEPFIQAGLREVQSFYPYCLEQEFVSGFEVIRPGDSLKMQNFRQFPQIAYNIRPMVYAAMEAYALTGEAGYARTAAQLAGWFWGANPAGRKMYDPETGRTFDGIGSPEEVNMNSGAESTIEALLSIQAVAAEPAPLRELKTIISRYE